MTVTAQIAKLNPQEECERIAYLLNCFEFPWDYERALEFALFRSYAVPSISQLLAKTGEFTKRPQKRYDDTELILSEIIEHGFTSARGQAAILRMNQMHGRFAIANDDLLYVLSTFIFEPFRWIARFGWRPLTPHEQQGMFHFYCTLGRLMYIQAIPTDLETFHAYNIAYEAKHFHHTATNTEIGVATRDLLLGFYLPQFLWPLGRPFVYAMMDKRLLQAFGFPDASPILRFGMTSALRLRAVLVRWLPRRQRPSLGTQKQRPTYPNGYKIEELGTFRA